MDSNNDNVNNTKNNNNNNVMPPTTYHKDIRKKKNNNIRNKSKYKQTLSNVQESRGVHPLALMAPVVSAMKTSPKKATI